MEIRLIGPTEGQAVTVTKGEDTILVPAWRTGPELAVIHGGRLNLLPMQVTGITAGVQFQRADGAWILDLRDVMGPPDMILPQGILRARQQAQERGFARGIVYFPAQDAQGDFIAMPGRLHRKIYVTAGENGYTTTEIAAHATAAGTPTTAAQVTGSWLAARPIYGGSEAMALHYDAYLLLSAALHGQNRVPRSDHIFFERGHVYNRPTSTTNKQDYGLKGESEIHPLLFSAWGTGSDPSLSVSWDQLGPRNIIFKDISTRYVMVKNAQNVAFSGGLHVAHAYFQGASVECLTVHELVVYDHVDNSPSGSNGLTWDGSKDRVSGIYLTQVYGMMEDGCLIDRNGWAEGYDFNRSAEFPMAPSDRNHGNYWTYTGGNYNIRDSWVTRNSSAGNQIRAGGYFEGNIYIDNNYATGGGTGTNLGPINQFLQSLDEMVFGAGYKTVVSFQGNIKGGFTAEGPRSTRLGAIVAHLANPDDPVEMDTRRYPGRPEWNAESPYSKDVDYSVNEIKVWKWGKNSADQYLNENVGGLNATTLDQTTPHRWAASKLGQPTATLNDLVNYLKRSDVRIGAAAREFSAWARARFGYSVPNRTAAANLLFQPNEHCEGFRADNRRNWSTLDLPGRNAADTMNLKGRFVRFASRTFTVAGMTSEGGQADFTGGRVTIGTLSDAADLAVRRSGQVVVGSAPHALRITTDSGLTKITGTAAALDLIARGHAEVVLGTSTHIPTGKKLLISGHLPMVGWDGTGSATLTVAGTLEFRAGIMLTNAGGYKNHHMITGNAVEGDNFTATLAEYREMSVGTNNQLYLCDVTGTPVAGESFKYHVRSDTEDGVDAFTDMITTVASVGAAGIPMLQRFRSGTVGDGLTEPTVTASLVLAAGSQVVIGRADLLLPGTYDLTGPGVTVTNNGATLPAGVAVTGGKLVLTVS